MTENSPINRADLDFVTELLLELGQEHSLDSLICKLMDRIIERSEMAKAEFYMVEKGDLCASCPRRRECADQTRCLHGFAIRKRPIASDTQVAAEPVSGVRIPLGAGVYGRMAANGQTVVIKDMSQAPDGLASAQWIREEKVRSFQGAPIVYNNEIMGVLAVFSRSIIPDGAKVWGGIFANHIAGAIANARAFDQIRKLKAELERHNAYLKEEVIEAKAFGDLVGQSGALRQVASQIDLVAPTDASVLILGETGVGKELVAYEIHRRSLRKDLPLIRVNCSSIPKELFESEFFGHAKGAFTGAIKERAGRFETAEGGTLFLDEISEVPLELQGKLLRVLQEKSYERVGEDHTRHPNVRIITATNRDLKHEAAAGRFRQDLYYRLNVFPIQVAPLRERKEDITLLAQHFIGLSVKEMRCAKPRLTRAGIVALQSYDWPGNIRELRNVIERAVILAQGRALEFDLPTAHPRSASAPLESQVQSPAPDSFLTESQMRQYEHDNLLRVLNQVRWKVKGVGGAAELLGIHPATLVSRMRKLHLKRPGANAGG